MKLPLRAVWAGGIFALCLAFGPGSGAAQGAGPASPPPPVSLPPPATTAPMSQADEAALKADPDCKPADVACAWSACYPLADKWNGSNSACLADSCKMKDKACVQDLVSDLYDPDRQASKGTR